jgi:hypothetical protein
MQLEEHEAHVAEGSLIGGHQAELLSRKAPSTVIPAKAGIQGKRRNPRAWIPAFAGMTKEKAGMAKEEKEIRSDIIPS